MRRIAIPILILLLASAANASWHFSSTDTVTMADAAVLTLQSGDWSVAGWAQIEGGEGTYRKLCEWGSESTSNWFRVYYATNNLVWFNIRGGAASTKTAGGANVSPGNDAGWVHLAVIRSGNTMTGYANGTALATAADLTYAYSINGATDWTWGHSGAWTGYLGEWAAWTDHALSAEELTALVGEGLPEECATTPEWHIEMYDDFVSQIGSLSITNVGDGTETARFDHPISDRISKAAENPFPTDASTSAGYRTPHLRWVDPAHDSTAFSVYLDTSNPPTTLVAEAIEVPYCTLASSLSMNTVYYWKVVSTSGGVEYTSAIWSFTTYDYPAGTKVFVGPVDTGDGSGSSEANVKQWSDVATETSSGNLLFIVAPDETIYNPDAVWTADRLYYAEAVTANNDDESWQFDRYYRVGQFCNGDIWVDGPVSIITISPVWDGDIHGTMINPTGGDTQGFRDTGTTYLSSAYLSSLNVTDETTPYLWPTHGLPMTVAATSSVVTAYGLAEVVDSTYHKSIGILTVLADPVATGSFRPPVVGGTSKVVTYNESDMSYDVLGTITAVDGQTIHKDTYTDATDWDETLERSVQRYHMSWGSGDLYRQNLSAYTHQTGYPMYTASQIGCVALALNCDYTNAQKRLLLCRMVQLGIEEYAIRVASSGGYNYGEGHAGLHGFPVLFAAKVLDDAAMYANVLAYKTDERSQYFYVSEATDVVTPDPTEGYALSSSGGTVAKIWSADGEGTKTGTVTVTNGSTTVSLNTGEWSGGAAETYFFGVVGDNRAFDPRGHVYQVTGTPSGSTITLAEAYDGVTNANARYTLSDCVYYGHGKGGKMDSENKYQYDYPEYVTRMVGLPEYGSFHSGSPLMAGPFWGFPGCFGTYRWSSPEGNGAAALTILIMGLVDEWGHNAYLDYMDRHYEYTSYILSLADHTGLGDGDLWYLQFERSMWAEYRDDYVAARPIWTCKADTPSGTSTLTWDAPDGIDKWDVYLDEADPPTTKVGDGVTTASFDTGDLGLKTSTVYYWTVSANVPDTTERIFNPDNLTPWLPSVWDFTSGDGGVISRSVTRSPIFGSVVR